MPTSRPNKIHGPCRRDRRGGFTLVEVVLAMSIMAMLVALGLPFVRPHIGMAALRSKAFEIGVLLRADRNAALRTGLPVTVSVDLAAQRVLSSRQRAQILLPTAILLRTQPRDLHGVEFLPDGHASGGRLLLISGNRAVAIDVNSLSAAIDVVDISQ